MKTIPANPLIEWNPCQDVWQNGRTLAKLMQSERKAHARSGFFFDFDGEAQHHSRYCPAMETTAGFMMEQAKRTGRPVEVFRNMHGEIAARLHRPEF